MSLADSVGFLSKGPGPSHEALTNYIVQRHQILPTSVRYLWWGLGSNTRELQNETNRRLSLAQLYHDNPLPEPDTHLIEVNFLHLFTASKA